MSTRPVTSRRHFLRGVGVALALPWMESLPRVRPGGRCPANTPPLRLGVVLLLERRRADPLVGEGSGATMELGPGAAPLMPHREDMVFIRGLYNQTAAVSTSPHLGRMNLLSGETVSLDPERDPRRHVDGPGDRVADRHRTVVPSLVLGIEPNELRLEDGLSMVYGSSLSWVSPTKPATKEIYPSRAFDRLVGDGSGRTLDRSILDAVRQDSRACGRNKPRRQRQAERVLRVDSRHREADRACVERGAPGRLAADAREAGHAAPEERAAAERARSHEADAGPDRARVPDGQDAHRDADAQQRPVADELQVRRRRPGRAAPRLDAQRQAPPTKRRCT